MTTAMANPKKVLCIFEAALEAVLSCAAFDPVALAVVPVLVDASDPVSAAEVARVEVTTAEVAEIDAVAVPSSTV